MNLENLDLKDRKYYTDMLEQYNQLLNDEKKNQKKYDLKELDSGTMEVEMIDLPSKRYMTDIKYINSNDDIDHIKLQMQRLEDKEMLKVSKDTELKNQSQRDTALRHNLLSNEIYRILYCLKQTILQLQNTLKSKMIYFDGINSNIKKIYYLRNELVLADKKMKEKGDKND
jgi:hypothetical protein